jgi:hypothetical protein
LNQADFKGPSTNPFIPVPETVDTSPEQRKEAYHYDTEAGRGNVYIYFTLESYHSDIVVKIIRDKQSSSLLIDGNTMWPIEQCIGSNAIFISN